MSRPLLSRAFPIPALTLLLVAGLSLACGDDGSSSDVVPCTSCLETGGSTASGGGSSQTETPLAGGSEAVGGAAASGGFDSAGGSSATSGGAAAGGAGAVGGTEAAGGKIAAGGIAEAGGMTATGGLPATGGMTATGGYSATGGVEQTGGGTTAGGSDASVEQTGGSTTAGGSDATGGIEQTGGGIATGGSDVVAPECCSTVTPEQAVSAVEGGALLVDVRTPEEYATQSIPGAINVPLDTLPGAMESVPGASPDEPIVVHCQSGNRSAQATTLLCDAGYCIYDMGGIGNWPEPF